MKNIIWATTWLSVLTFNADTNFAQQVDPISWSRSFSRGSTLNPSDASEPLLQVVVMTDDDETTDASQFWCRKDFDHSIRAAARVRSDIPTICRFQSLGAAASKHVSGGASRSQSMRAITAVCDPSYRLLALSVGVPTGDELLAMIEDAQQVQTLLGLSQDQRPKLVQAVSERSDARLSRMWRSAMKQALDSIDSTKNLLGATTFDSEDVFRKQLVRIAMNLQEVYHADVKNRFDLRDATAVNRLLALEQSLQTREPWCDALMPLLAGVNLEQHWMDLAEMVWRTDVGSTKVDAADLLTWWDEQVSREPMVVLRISPPTLMQAVPWPPGGDAGEKRGMGWNDLVEKLAKQPTREVDSRVLAHLIQERGLAAVDLWIPSRLRYLVYDPQSKKSLLIRQRDIPAQHIGRLKRLVPE